MKQVVLVFLGGGLGSAMRYGLSKWLNASGSSIPYGTLTANVVGSVLIGIVLGYAMRNAMLSQHMTLLLATGFCGGFTTFSTFAFENQTFLKNGDFLSFGLYTIGSFVLALAAIFLGLWIAKSV